MKKNVVFASPKVPGSPECVHSMWMSSVERKEGRRKEKIQSNDRQ